MTKDNRAVHMQNLMKKEMADVMYGTTLTTPSVVMRHNIIARVISMYNPDTSMSCRSVSTRRVALKFSIVSYALVRALAACVYAPEVLIERRCVSLWIVASVLADVGVVHTVRLGRRKKSFKCVLVGRCVHSNVFTKCCGLCRQALDRFLKLDAPSRIA